ncbi:hypothetical protein BGX31_008708 [Mortierella sp. GBA43]|nr:hypothetical protein BGX31_008708 [Mortierella sp. GBA43]
MNSSDDSATPIPRLPPECLEMVLHFLRFDRTSLFKLLTVSRPFFQLTVPILYKRWSQALIRIELLTRLLIRNLKLGSPERVSGGLDGYEWCDDGSRASSDDGWGSVTPARTGSTSNAHPSAWGWGDTDWNTNDVSVNQQGQDDGGRHPDLISFDSDQHPDLITFDSCDSDKDKDKDTSNKDNNTSDSKSPQGHGLPEDLFTDYFSFFTHQKHQLIEMVIRQIFPGYNTMEYQVYMNHVNEAILVHSIEHVELVQLHSPSLMVPILQRHLNKLGRLKFVDVLDNWSGSGHELVYEFLKSHSEKFSTPRCDIADNEGSYSGTAHTTLRQGAHHQTSGIRHFKFISPRTRWNTTLLNEEPFTPARMMEAMDHGLESIDLLCCPEDGLGDLEVLDVSSLHTLKVWFSEYPNDDVTFSRPEFLSRCRQLRTLDMYSNSKDMFSWAVQDWNNRRTKPNTALNMEESAKHPIPTRPLTKLQHLRVHGYEHETTYSILRDVLYGFRESLREVALITTNESNESNDDTWGWMDQQYQGNLATGIEGTANGYDDCELEWVDQKYGGNSPAGTDVSYPTIVHDESGLEWVGQKYGGTLATGTNASHPYETKSTKKMDDEGWYNKYSSSTLGPFLIQWPVPFLTILELKGTIATLDVKSLQCMPCLHSLSLVVDIQPTSSRSRGVFYPPGQRNRARALLGLMALPYLAPKSLRRVLIGGPWPEISDDSLRTMIDLIPAHALNKDVNTTHGYVDTEGTNSNGDKGNEDAKWGMQLMELSILNNPQSTVPGMIRLARDMDRLEVMGTGLNLQKPRTEWEIGPSRPMDDLDKSMMELMESELSTEKDTRFGKEYRNRAIQEESIARNLVLKARVEMPWIDLGPDANYLGRQK